jgi:putative spermidine/putrescine transport system permease protein
MSAVTNMPPIRQPGFALRTRPKWLQAVTRALWGACIVVLFVYIALPTLFVFPLALTGGDVLTFPPQGLSFIHVKNVAADPMWREAFSTSIQVAIMAAVMAAVLGTALAAVIPRRGWLRLSLEATVALPLVIPPVVLAVAWFGPWSSLQMLYTPLGVAVTHAFLGLPFVYLNVAGAINSMDPQLPLAARSLGARPAVVFARITFPLVLPGIIAGVVLTLIFSFDELILALFLGGGAVATLPVSMWGQIQYVTSPDIAAVAMIATTLTISAVALALGIQVAVRRRGR